MDDNDNATAIVKAAPVEIINKLVAENDLSLLSPGERLMYYRWRCQSIGVDHMAQPFEYLKLDGKLVLYPKAYLADQLRQLHKISVTLGESSLEHGVYTRIAVARDASGRQAENIGAVSVIYPERRKVWDNGRSSWEPHPMAGKQFVGADMANAIKKATTQAQRRATFSLVGLGGQDTDDVEGVERLDVSAVHSDAMPARPPETAPAAHDGPIEWTEPNKWPAGDPTIITAKVTGVRRSKSSKAEWLTVTVEDGDPVTLSTFHLSAEPVLTAAIGKVCDVMYMKKDRGNQLLDVREARP